MMRHPWSSLLTMTPILQLSSPRSWRGGEQQLWYLQTSLEPKTWTSHIACPDQSALHQRLVNEAPQTPFCPLPTNIHTGLIAAWKLTRYCKKHRIALIHCHDARAHAVAYLATVIWRNRIPLIVSRKVDFAVKATKSSRKKYLNPWIKRYLCVSQAVQDILTQTVEPERCEVIYDGIDVARFQHAFPQDVRQELGLSPNAKLVTCVAALADHKDHATLLKAARALARKDTYFLLVGTGALQATLQQQCQQHGLQQYVIFLGQRDDVPRLLHNSDLFLMTSKTEGLCQSILEAMAAGLPVVATAAGGIPEIVRHQKTGLLAKVGDAQHLAHHIDTLLNDVAYAKTLSTQAKAWAAEFDYSHMAEKTCLAYQAVLATP